MIIAFFPGIHICLLLILFCLVSLLFAEGIFRAQLLELEKENSQANGVSRFVFTCVWWVFSDEAKKHDSFSKILALPKNRIKLNVKNL